jgi:hypothetical protein
LITFTSTVAIVAGAVEVVPLREGTGVGVTGRDFLFEPIKENNSMIHTETQQRQSILSAFILENHSSVVSFFSTRKNYRN